MILTISPYKNKLEEFEAKKKQAAEDKETKKKERENKKSKKLEQMKIKQETKEIRMKKAAEKKKDQNNGPRTKNKREIDEAEPGPSTRNKRKINEDKPGPSTRGCEPKKSKMKRKLDFVGEEDKGWWCCLCSENIEEDMIQCSACHTWVHTKCAGTDSAFTVDYKCDFCTEN